MPSRSNCLIGKDGSLWAVIPGITWSFRGCKLFPRAKVASIAQLTILVTSSTRALTVCSNTTRIKFKRTWNTKCSLGTWSPCYAIIGCSSVRSTKTYIARVTLSPWDGQTLRITIPITQAQQADELNVHHTTLLAKHFKWSFNFLINNHFLKHKQANISVFM